MSVPRRNLSPDEERILGLIIDYYGPANTFDHVFFTVRDHAMIYIMDHERNVGALVDLTGIPERQRRDGVPDDQVRARYLSPPIPSKDSPPPDAFPSDPGTTSPT
jgi:hypothetical protein